MNNTENNMVKTADDDFDSILPEGWGGVEGEDIFDPDTWVGFEPDGAEETTGEEGKNAEEEDGSPTTESTDDSTTGAEYGEGDPTTDADADDGKLHFRVSIDHREQDIALDPTELPTLYQKAQVLDRYQTRVRELEAELGRFDKIAKGLNYSDRRAMHDGIIDNIVQTYMDEHPGVPDDMARDYVTRKFELEKIPAAEDARPTEESGRDYRAEVAELFRAFPDARNERIPDEVTNNDIA